MALNFAFTWYATNKWSLPDIEKVFVSDNLVPVWWQFPLLALVVPLLLWWLVNFLLDKENIRQPKQIMAVLIIGFAVFSLIGQVSILLIAAGVISPKTGAGSILTIMYVLLLAIGNYITTARQSWLTGWPTPWAMASALSWAKTHRFLGRSIIAVTLVSLVTTLMGNMVDGLHILFFGSIAVLLLSTIYSWIVWKNDPAMKK